MASVLHTVVQLEKLLPVDDMTMRVIVDSLNSPPRASGEFVKPIELAHLAAKTK